MSQVEPDQRGDLLWSPRAEKVLRPVGPIVVAVAGLLMLGWSWGKWPDVLVDFGQQLYLPWQLAEGKRLYADLAYFHGPLAQYANALWFRLLGTGLWTAVFTNLLVLAVLVLLLHRLLLRVSSALGATVAGVVFIVMFAFAQYVGIGNYNYVTPYEHSATYGMLTSIAALWFLGRNLDGGRLADLVGAGLCLGLTFLTKAEIFVAAGAAVAVGLASAMWARPQDRRRGPRTAAVLAGATLAPVVAAWLLLMLTMPAGQALVGALGPWPSVIEGDVAGLRFYRGGMGTIYTGVSVLELIGWVAWYAVIFVSALAIALKVRTRGRPARIVAASCFGVVAGGLALLRSTIPWDEVARPLPVAMAAAILAQLITLARARGGSEVAVRERMKLAMLVFAFVLLFKMILNTRVSHYGFVLAMPATLLFTVAVVDWIPRRIIRKGGGGEIFGAMALAAVLVTVVCHVRIMSVFYRAKTYTVASGRDAFSADVGGLAVNLALEAIADHVGPQQTLAVLPEGVMLNYLARRVNPTPHHAFMPPSLIAFGEEEILQAFKDDPPDFIMLVHKDTSEFGFRFFGRDYGLQIAAWISAGYEPLQLTGAPPLQDDRFGILLLRRKPS